MTEKRFDVISLQTDDRAVLIDRESEFIAIPLYFSLDELTENEQERLQEWIDLLNENEQLKKEISWWKYKCGEDISGDCDD